MNIPLQVVDELRLETESTQTARESPSVGNGSRIRTSCMHAIALVFNLMNCCKSITLMMRVGSQRYNCIYVYTRCILCWLA